MTEYTAKEIGLQEDTYEGYDETIEVAIMSKVQKYFDLHKKLKYNQLNSFLESINLSDVFGTDEEKQTIWNIFSRLSSNNKEIDYETCKRGMRELFIFYGLTSEEAEENLTLNNVSNEKEYLYEFNSDVNYNKNTTEFSTTPYRKTVNNFRESVNSNNKKLDDLLLRISMKNTPDKFPHFNTPYVDSEFSNRENTNDFKNTNRFNLQNKINQIEGVETNTIRRTHERKITKMFTEIDIDKLQQLRKIFTLLDLRNKENVYLSEIQEVINKYKFIKLTTDELINFLRLISDDIIKSGDNGHHKLSINFELYSRAVSAIEQQLLQVNSDTFTEKNDSYEMNDNYNELIEDLNRMEYETVDHIMVLADIIKSSEFRVKESMIENYEKLLNKKFSNSENENLIKQNIKDGVGIYHNKIKDTQLFLKELNQFCIKKQNKISSLKIVISKLENSLKNSEEDYRSLFEKFNMSQPVEIDDETERLIEENSYLNEQKRIKEEKIRIIQVEMNEREEQIFYLKNELEKFKTKESENKTAYTNLKKEYEILEKNYNFLVNDIYEKIEKEDFKEPTHMKKDSSSTKSSYSSYTKQVKESQNFSKIKEKLGKNDDTKNVLEMNYDQLVLYTLKLDSLNKQLEEKNLQKDLRLKELEKEMTEMKKITSENSKTIYQLKTENVRLQEKISEMNKEIEINNMFRPSRVLNNRISRISRMNDTRYSNMSNNITNPMVGNKTGNAGRFQKMQKLFELDANSTNNDVSRIDDNKSNFFNKSKAIEEDSQPDVRISKLELEDVSADISYDIKLNNEDKSRIQGNLNSFDIGNKYNEKNGMSNRVTFDNLDISNGNHLTFKNFPTKGQDSLNNNRNQISSNIALEVSTFTNRNTGLFSQKDPFAASETFLFDEKGPEISEKDYEINTPSKEKNTRLQYSYRPEDEFFIDKTENVKLDSENNNDAIIDDLDENPFPIKNEREETDEQDGEELDSSVNLNKIAKHSPFDVDIKEMKKNREKLKQSITRQNTIEQATTAIFVNKPSRRLPSLITEEVLEEDNNGDIIGTPSKPEKKSIESSSLKKSISSGSNRMSEEMLRTHTRMNTMDLDTVFNKDSQYVCYDFLTLRKSQGIIKMLEEHSEDVSSYEMFSDNVFLIDENSKKSKKYLFITSNSIYILRPYDVSTKIRIRLKDLNKLTISNKNCNLIAFHFNEGCDLLVEILRRMELLYYFRDLYRMKGFGKLKFKYSDNFKIKRNNVISNIIVNQANNFFIAPNFENAQKLGYLSKLSGRFFTNFNEKLVVLTNIGLLYFDDPNKPPKRLIPIIGSDIVKIEEKKYKRKYCFEIKTLNGESIVFGAKTDEELESWIIEFKNFKKNYEKKIKNIEGSSKK